MVVTTVYITENYKNFISDYNLKAKRQKVCFTLTIPLKK